MALAALRLPFSYASVYRHTASPPGSRTPQHRIHQASYSVEDIPPYPGHPLASSSTQTAKPLPHHRASTRQHAPSRTPSPGRSRPFRHILCEFYTTQPSTLPLQLRPPHTGITYLTTPSCLQILNQNPHRDIHTLPPAGRRSHSRHPMPPRSSPQHVPVLIFYPLPLHLTLSRPNLLPWPKFIPQLSVPPLDTML